MTAGRPQNDYTGRVFGTVTVLRRKGAQMWCRCTCGHERYHHLNNLLSSPPKTHSRCRKPDLQLELFVDSHDVQAYNGAS